MLFLLQASTQGLVRELQRQGRAEGARVLCPVPLVTGGLVEPPVVPKFLKALEVLLGVTMTCLNMLMSLSGASLLAKRNCTTSLGQSVIIASVSHVSVGHCVCGL